MAATISSAAVTKATRERCSSCLTNRSMVSRSGRHNAVTARRFRNRAINDNGQGEEGSFGCCGAIFVPANQSDERITGLLAVAQRGGAADFHARNDKFIR